MNEQDFRSWLVFFLRNTQGIRSASSSVQVSGAGTLCTALFRPLCVMKSRSVGKIASGKVVQKLISTTPGKRHHASLSSSLMRFDSNFAKRFDWRCDFLEEDLDWVAKWNNAFRGRKKKACRMRFFFRQNRPILVNAQKYDESGLNYSLNLLLLLGIRQNYSAHQPGCHFRRLDSGLAGRETQINDGGGSNP